MKKIDKSVILIPTALILVVGLLITLFPVKAINIISTIRNFFGNTLSSYYLIFGLLVFILLLVFAFSKIGKIKIGQQSDKPMNIFTWGVLIFTSTMAADILFYSFHEWAYYYESTSLAQSSISDTVAQSMSYSLFHWGFIPWSFYLILAAIYAYMFFNKHRKTQKMSEACRPILGKYTDKLPGKLINIIAIFGLLCGTATTFSVTTPLMTALIGKIFNFEPTVLVSVFILIFIAIIYGTAVLTKKGITIVAKITIFSFSFILALFFILGGPRFIIETGLQGFGNMLQNFISMSTWTEPARVTSAFPQDWTVFYWAYWIAWAVATPFFIAKISKGRTIKQILLVGGACGLLGTFSSFIIFGGFGLNLQSSGSFNIAALINSGISPATVIVEMISFKLNHNIIITTIICAAIFITMCMLYASTFDALTEVVSVFSYKELKNDELPSKKMKLYWVAIFLILPVSLLFLKTTNQLLMSVAIIGAFPLTIIMLLIFISFIKEIRTESKVKE